MPPPTTPSHPDTLEAALPHYNDHFRHRYRLPRVTAAWLRRDLPEIDRLIEEELPARQNGVADVSCAVIARIALSIVPRYAIGFVDGKGVISVDAPGEGDPRSYWSSHALLVNPLGGRDNWESVAGWIRRISGDRARRTQLAGLASERRPDDAANWELLTRSAAEDQHAIILPPDEAFSTERAAEVSYIYGVPIETLRAWKQRNRRDLAAGKPGAPRKKPVRSTPPP